MTSDKSLYKSVIFDGAMVEANGVSLCNLEDVMHSSAPRAKYQVWSDKHRYYELFHNLGDAVDKFLELKEKRWN
jgi:hypothetical protein